MTEAGIGDDPDRLLQIPRETCLSEIRCDRPDLTLRQLAVLLIVYQTEELQTVRGLAKHLNISKPVVTHVLNRLEELDLAYRKIDPKDRRSVLVQRTPGGAAMMERLRATMAAATTEAAQQAAEQP
ncbi:MarR family transcriptional regulator [Belnapia sp. T18]|uniref:MarR family transcriptional regulator n=1 Tax=Belnapia arida TaxID=2804533 RepID=A0ABS1UFW7_9PROT|nr:MarR family transcriptional regulator [Belnapia arida]MBL6082597.1 MarR family transcriptional regulator [Belnapia arida]